MSQSELLAKIVAALTDANVSYMLTGSVVSSAMGEPRSTHDIDVVVEITPEQIERIAVAFPQGQYRFDLVAATTAAAKRDMFQLSEYSSGDKIDFWVLTDDPFDRNAFARRTMGNILNIQTYLPRPEDVILKKLKWAKDYESERQYRDALGVFELQYGGLDQTYLAKWIEQLELREIWEQMLSEAEPLDGDR